MRDGLDEDHLGSGIPSTENNLFVKNVPPHEGNILRQNLYEPESFNADPISESNTIESLSEVFAVFNHPPTSETIPYQIEEGTTEDQAEFITHQSNAQDYDPERDRLEQMTKNSKSKVYYYGQSNTPKDSSSQYPGLQKQNNQNERNRARAEEISHDNFKFVCNWC